LLHVTDAADPDFRRHLIAVDAVLDEILTEPRPPRIMVFNKSDRLSDVALATLRVEFPDCLVVSALKQVGLDGLRAEIFRRVAASTPLRRGHAADDEVAEPVEGTS